LKAPNPKIQAPEKHQQPSFKTVVRRFGAGDFYGGWSLELLEMPFTISQLNDLDHAEFTRIIGPVFEHSPWIAEMTWSRRPFASAEQLHNALCETVRAAGQEKQLALIRAHPDLVGRAALAGTLTRESTGEQASAGLSALSPAEIDLFQKQNAVYREKFGFSFVICARLNKKNAILAGFERRLKNSQEQEMEAALEEIFKIAELRLRDLTHP
jgi:2-oxo-4-hydroxy-4-carboxy-5-ureidoimidazoline decarboxylase